MTQKIGGKGYSRYEIILARGDELRKEVYEKAVQIMREDPYISTTKLRTKIKGSHGIVRKAYFTIRQTPEWKQWCKEKNNELLERDDRDSRRAGSPESS